MQCPSCRAVFSNGLSVCPRCKTPANKPSPDAETKSMYSTSEESIQTEPAVTAAQPEPPPETAPVQPASTLIEFPGVSRASRPQWRKELSERVREIQERRSRKAVREKEEAARRRIEQPAHESGTPQLGLVPAPEVPELNPIVAAALARLERARQPSMPRTRGGRGSSVAVARVIEEEYQPEILPAPKPVPVKAAPAITPAPQLLQTPEEHLQIKSESVKSEHVRERNLVVISTPIVEPAIKTEIKQESAPVVAKEIEADLFLDDLADSVPAEEIYDDRAPLVARIAGGIIDLIVVAFAVTPFAAIIELTNGNWADWRVEACICAITVAVMFLYLTTATAIAGRTWGMSLVHLRAVDVNTGLPPTTKQSIGRALGYMLSLPIIFGLLYTLFDAEGRAAHDHLSGTAVVRE